MLTQDQAELDDVDLERRLVYCVLAAGKNARFAATKVEALFGRRSHGQRPFEVVRGWILAGTLEQNLRECKIGAYRRNNLCFRQLAVARLNLRTCQPSHLAAIHGIGPKTARFFLQQTRPGERVAVLDVHILRWLRSCGYAAPASTPSSSSAYARWECHFLEEATKRGLAPYQLDRIVWEAASRNADTQRAFQ